MENIANNQTKNLAPKSIYFWAHSSDEIMTKVNMKTTSNFHFLLGFTSPHYGHRLHLTSNHGMDPQIKPNELTLKFFLQEFFNDLD